MAAVLSCSPCSELPALEFSTAPAPFSATPARSCGARPYPLLVALSPAGQLACALLCVELPAQWFPFPATALVFFPAHSFLLPRVFFRWAQLAVELLLPCSRRRVASCARPWQPCLLPGVSSLCVAAPWLSLSCARPSAQLGSHPAPRAQLPWPPNTLSSSAPLRSARLLLSA